MGRRASTRIRSSDLASAPTLRASRARSRRTAARGRAARPAAMSSSARRRRDAGGGEQSGDDPDLHRGGGEEDDEQLVRAGDEPDGAAGQERGAGGSLRAQPVDALLGPCERVLAAEDRPGGLGGTEALGCRGQVHRETNRT